MDAGAPTPRAGGGGRAAGGGLGEVVALRAEHAALRARVEELAPIVLLGPVGCAPQESTA